MKWSILYFNRPDQLAYNAFFADPP